MHALCSESTSESKGILHVSPDLWVQGKKPGWACSAQIVTSAANVLSEFERTIAGKPETPHSTYALGCTTDLLPLSSPQPDPSPTQGLLFLFQVCRLWLRGNMRDCGVPQILILPTKYNCPSLTCLGGKNMLGIYHAIPSERTTHKCAAQKTTIKFRRTRVRVRFHCWQKGT